MGIEAISPGLGVLDVRDVHAVRPAPGTNGAAALVCVLSDDGSSAFVGLVSLGQLHAGRGRHEALLCPRCGKPKRRLYLDGPNELACAACARMRTRYQREKNRSEYRRRGGRIEDRLLRMLSRPGRCCHGGLVAAAALAERLAAHDALLARTVERYLGRTQEASPHVSGP